MDTATGCATLASALGRRGPTARTEHVASQSVGKTLYWYRATTRTHASRESGLPAVTTVNVSSLNEACGSNYDCMPGLLIDKETLRSYQRKANTRAV